MRVVFGLASGALTSLVHKPSGWIMHGRPEVGASFRMQVPIPGWHDSFVLGQKQRAVRAE